MDPLDYPWSSYEHHAGGKLNPVITDHPLYWALGNTPFQREAAYIELAQQALTTAELETINQAVLRGRPLGSERYQADLEQTMKRQILPAKRGRPVKKDQLIRL